MSWKVFDVAVGGDDDDENDDDDDDDDDDNVPFDSSAACFLVFFWGIFCFLICLLVW